MKGYFKLEFKKWRVGKSKNKVAKRSSIYDFP